MCANATGKQYERYLSTRNDDSITFYSNSWKYCLLGVSAKRADADQILGRHVYCYRKPGMFYIES